MSGHQEDKSRGDLEQRIVRRLDGAMRPDEELALNRELIRDPHARQIADDYQRIDLWAAAALEPVVAESGPAIDLDAITVRRAALARGAAYSRAWWFLPAALAASLGFAVIPRLPSPLPENDGRLISTGDLSSLPREGLSIGSHGVEWRGDGLRRAATSPEAPQRLMKRNIDRDFLGVLGDDGNIYWLEVDRTRVIQEPNPQSAVRRAAGEL